MRTSLLAALLLGACAPAADPFVATQPIINGQAPNRPEHDAVVSLHGKYINANVFNPNIFCSGTLISPSVVLTAAHCLDVANGGNAFKTRAPSDLAINFGDDPAASFSPQAVSQTLIHPKYDRRKLVNDVALVRLASAQDGVSVANLPSNLNFTQADVGTMLNFAGFGYSDTAKSEIGVKLQADTPLGSLGCTIAGCPSGAPADTQIAYTQAVGPCNGDSGGPAFIDRAGTWYVGGVTSYGDVGCEVYGVSTNVAPFASFIDAFEACTPSPEVCGDSVDNDCDSVVDEGCAPAACVSPPSCGADADCCSGQVCKRGACRRR